MIPPHPLRCETCGNLEINPNDDWFCKISGEELAGEIEVKTHRMYGCASHTAAKSEREVLVNLIDWMKDTIDLIDVRRNAGRYVSPTEEGMRITLLEVIEKYEELRLQPREQGS